jgi:aminopeptidase YwaD
MKTRPRCVLLSFLFLFPFSLVEAQEIRTLKHEITSLCSPTMSGRGYVQKGRDRAAMHIMRKMRDAGLQPVTPDSIFYQYYTFPVVSFPDTVFLQVGKKVLLPGEEYLVDAASDSYHSRKQKVSTIDVGELADSTDWEAIRHRLRPDRINMLRGTDSLARLLHIRPSRLAETLPRGAYILPISGKMTWTVATDTIAATVFYVQDSALPKRVRKTTIDVHSKLEPAAKSANVMGMVRGTEVPDSFIVFTAHYDHLGKMGWDVTFPGASDNASGTAMMLYLAAHYARNPQRYSMLFIAFSGEEAGLKGSKFYTSHPLVPLANMRFLVNLDIMGNAQDGVTVVNATEHPREFSMLEAINKKEDYLPAIRSRGKAANSDHYHFSEAGVPSFFLYSNGGPGYYHDIFDKPTTLTLTNIDKVLHLLMAFTTGLQGK